MTSTPVTFIWEFPPGCLALKKSFSGLLTYRRQQHSSGQTYTCDGVKFLHNALAVMVITELLIKEK